MAVSCENALIEFLRLHDTSFIYGTAWKKEKTEDLVYEALQNGFRIVDTAAQPLHYNEELVGIGIRKAISEGLINRNDIFVQTKYSPGQSIHEELSLPYDPSTSIHEQIESSIASSLRHLGTDSHQHLASSRTFVPAKVKCLGISNTDLATLEILTRYAQVKPMVVQNRFYAATGYDSTIRRHCNDHGIIYQAYWTLTANPHLLQSQWIVDFARLVDVEPAAALYSLIASLPGVLVLNGTSSRLRMELDVRAINKASKWRLDNEETWGKFFQSFQNIIGCKDQAS